MSVDDKNSNPEQKKVINFYSALGAALLLSLVPSAMTALVSTILFGGVLIVAYGVRAKSDEGSLIENHTTFIIRTVWISSLFGMISVGLGSLYLLMNHDQTPLNICAHSFIGSAQSMTDPVALTSFFEGCIEEYWVLNKNTLIISMAVSIVPILIYFVVRYARGLSRAHNGHRVSYPRRWF